MRFGMLTDLDQAVQEELDALGNGLERKPYIRPVPNDETIMWEAGWEGEYSDEVREAAGKALDHHLRLPVAHRRAGRISMLQFVIEGKRPIFLIAGRNPTTRDVDELRKRDHAYRHSLEKHLADMEQLACGETDDQRDERIRKLAESLADDRTLYQMLEFGRKSALVQGLKGGFQ